MKCPKCQTENKEGARFCNECGTRLEIICEKCKSRNSPGNKFCNECGQPLTKSREPSSSDYIDPQSYTPKYLAEKILTSRAALEGERKQVTVLFVDLKGSMELLADRDPEEARTLLDPVLERMMEAVHRYEGTVSQVMGDGIMALFGAPVAHEDHAVRASYAALRMQETIGQHAKEIQRTKGVPLQIRVGLNSGEVVVRSIGNDLHMDYSAVGQTTHLAARMEQTAMPGSILISADTMTLAEGYVQVKPLGPVAIKGLDAPMEVYELIGAMPLRSRLEAAAARGLTPFVGRQREVEALVHALGRAQAGHGQVVGVLGEPGVGKTRLFYEFIHTHPLQGWLFLETWSMSYGKATAYLPVLELLKAYFQIEARDNVRQMREKITGKLLTLDPALQPTLPAFLALLDVPGEDPQWQALDPAQRRQRTLDALKRLVLRESQVQPLCLIVENLHWIDAETQAWLDSLIESLPTAQLLLLVNFRPEYQHGWGSKTYYTQLQLDPLQPESAEELLQGLLGSDRTLQLLKRLLIEGTEGNPFFLEESVRTLVETQVLTGARGAYRLMTALPSIQVSPTVQAVLAARIDRLPSEEKRLLQAAAVVGKDVPFPLLQEIAELPEDALRHSLTHLQAAEFLYEISLFPDLEYTFKHALTHQVAYGSLLQERRRVLHARIVEAIEQLYPDRLVEQVNRLAHHAFRGEVWNKAFTYSRQAGDKAATRSANREAVAWYEQALVTLGHFPQSRETLEQAIDLRFDLRNALFPLGEHERMLDPLREAKALAETLGDQRRLGWVFSYMAQYFRITGDPDRAIESAQHVITIARSIPDFVLEIATSTHLGPLYRERGDYRRAIEILRKNLDSLQGSLARERFGLAGLPSVLLRFHLVWCLAELGNFTEGIVCAQEGIRIAEEVDNPYSLMFAYAGAGILRLLRGELSQATPVLERGFELCRVRNFPIPFSLIASPLGIAYALSGRLAEAIPLLEQALEQATAMKLMVNRSIVVAWLGQAYLLSGRVDDALRLAGHALENSRKQSERGYEAYTLRLLGEITAQTNPPDVHNAQAYYRQAMELADELGMRPLVAHCHLGLGMLYRRTGGRSDAETHLTAATALFHGMDMRFWVEKAEAELKAVR